MQEVVYFYFCSGCRKQKEMSSPYFEGEPHYDCNSSNGTWVLYRPTTPEGEMITPIPQISIEYCVDLLSQAEPATLAAAIRSLQKALHHKKTNSA